MFFSSVCCTDFLELVSPCSCKSSSYSFSPGSIYICGISFETDIYFDTVQLVFECPVALHTLYLTKICCNLCSSFAEGPWFCVGTTRTPSCITFCSDKWVIIVLMRLSASKMVCLQMGRVQYLPRVKLDVLVGFLVMFRRHGVLSSGY